MPLTKTQKAALKELRAIAALVNLDYDTIEAHPPDSRLTQLLVAKHKIVRGQIVLWYTLVDEFLCIRICRYFFPKKPFPVLWKTKRFQLFNYHVLEELALMQKLRFVKGIEDIPKPISHDIERLNALRNGIAHAFFPENLKKSPPTWKGKNVFSLEGLQTLEEDVQKIFRYFEALDPSFGADSV